MAIDLFCYLAENQSEAQEKILRLRDEHSDLFPGYFWPSEAMEISAIGKEIASAYGFDAASRFLMHLGRKDQVDRMEEVEKIVKNVFGEENILILFENESKH
jgi:hypothetical protein